MQIHKEGQLQTLWETITDTIVWLLLGHDGHETAGVKTTGESTVLTVESSDVKEAEGYPSVQMDEQPPCDWMNNWGRDPWSTSVDE